MEEIVQNAANGAISSVTPEQSFETRFNNLERNLELFQENARHMGVIASDFNLKSQEPLNQKVHTLVSGLQVLDQMKNQFVDVRVPIRLLDILDEGKNPQLFTKELLEDTRNRNKELNGKTELYKKFQYHLIRELKQEMPNDVDEYLRVRKISGVSGSGNNNNNGHSHSTSSHPTAGEASRPIEDNSPQQQQ